MTLISLKHIYVCLDCMSETAVYLGSRSEFPNNRYSD
jgi:hypothetical protein